MGRQRRAEKPRQNRTVGEPSTPLISEKEARDQRIWQLDLAGYSSREIGIKVGLNKTTVCEILHALRNQPSAIWSNEEVRTTEHARLLRLLRALEPGVEQHDPVAIREARLISESLRKMYGADGPIEITVTETTQADLAVRDMINEAKARAAAEREKITGGHG
jgi:hypothetical protein